MCVLSSDSQKLLCYVDPIMLSVGGDITVRSTAKNLVVVQSVKCALVAGSIGASIPS